MQQPNLQDPTSLSIQAIESELLTSIADRQGTKHRQLRLLIEFDQRKAWVLYGATSCAVWWADLSGIERSTAREQLRVARAMADYDALDAALESGRISYAKLKAISRLADADTVDELIELAEDCPAGHLGVLLAAWRRRREDDDTISAAQYDARKLTWRTEPDGMVTFTLRARPAEAGPLEIAVDTLVMSSDAPAGASLAQMRADAFCRLATQGGSVSAEVVVHVSVDEQGNLCAALTDGTPVPNPQLSELLCESTIRALLHDSAGKPIDASPARKAPTKRQMRLLEERDGHCQYKGCKAKAFLHSHHVIHREHHGPTVIANLVLMCGFHHRLLHEQE